jgi:hypothetical protein
MARTNIKIIIYYLFLIVAFVSMFTIILFLPKPEQVVYNCTMSEISPDFPLEVKDACRKLRLENFKNDTSR